MCFIFFFQAEDGIRDIGVTGVQTCALPICRRPPGRPDPPGSRPLTANTVTLFPNRRKRGWRAAILGADTARPGGTEIPPARTRHPWARLSAVPTASVVARATDAERSEKRRVGKEGRSRWP